MNPTIEFTATFVTIANSRYFLGTVALVNSLQLTNQGCRILVVDSGLTEAQKAQLQQACEVRPLPADRDETFAAFFKPAAHMLGLSGPIVLIDSDMIVTESFAPLVSQAVDGRICLFADTRVMAGRRFPEWEQLLAPGKHLRFQPYLHAGCLVLDVDIWQGLLARWWELCLRVRAERSPTPFDDDDPFGYVDQDLLNVLLMSEVPEDRISVLDWELAASPEFNRETRVLDRSDLSCVNGKRRTFLLHYAWNGPKPWFPGARARLGFDAYVDLMARLLTSTDVPIRLETDAVPLWLRDTPTGRFVRRTPRHVRRAVRSVLSLLPDPIEQKSREVGGAIARRLRLG